jgi:hypothetical protein
MDKLDAIQALEQQITESVAYQARSRLEALTLAYRIFDANYHELRNFLTHLEKPEVLLTWASWDKRQERDMVILEITRRLHNFLASVKTLIDHTRKLIKKWYSQSTFFGDYTSEVKGRFDDNLMTKFVEELRNYTLHYHLPLSYLQFEVNRDPISNELVGHSAIVLKKSQLSPDYNWNKGQKYLATINENIILIELIDDYFKTILSFHSWMHKRLHEIYAEDLKWLEISIKKLNHLKANINSMSDDINK